MTLGSGLHGGCFSSCAINKLFVLDSEEPPIDTPDWWPTPPRRFELLRGDLIGCMLLPMLLLGWFCSSCLRSISLPVVGIPPTAPALGGLSELKSELFPNPMFGCCGLGIRGPPGPIRVLLGGGEPDREGIPGLMSKKNKKNHETFQSIEYVSFILSFILVFCVNIMKT